MPSMRGLGALLAVSVKRDNFGVRVRGSHQPLAQVLREDEGVVGFEVDAAVAYYAAGVVSQRDEHAARHGAFGLEPYTQHLSDVRRNAEGLHLWVLALELYGLHRPILGHSLVVGGAVAGSARSALGSLLWRCLPP